jgi:nickel-dependent lactate racemase
MRIPLAYGRAILHVELPDDRRVDVLEKRPVSPIRHPDDALRRALEHPIASAPLRQLARGRRDAVIVVSDHTRPVPNAVLLPPILEALRDAGLPREAVTLQVATGLHRPSTSDELREMLGSEIAGSFAIRQHDARDLSAHTYLGDTPGGIPIWIDRFYLERDLRILTGLIEPHLMAGYSGGRKAVCPGLAAAPTLRVAHGPDLLEGRIGPGIVEGNPLHADLVDALRRAGADFLVNVALDPERRIAGVFCGDVEQAHAAGMTSVADETHVQIDAPADLVVVSGAGHPLDATYYQAIKGIATASGIVRPGGFILLCASLSEGVGSASFEALLRECGSPMGFERKLRGEDFFAIDQWMVQHLCQAHRRARVLLYSDGAANWTDRELLAERVASPEAGVQRALDSCGADARIAVLPQGPYLIASVRGEKRPLGGPILRDDFETPWLDSGPSA